MAVREGRWDCRSCGTVGVRGRDVACPHCGTPRPKGVRFYLPEDAQEVTDAEQLRQAAAGADWVCEHCGAGNRALAAECGGCGAPLGGSGRLETHEYAPGEVPRGGARRAAAPPPPPPSTRRGGGFRRALRWGVGLAGVGAAVWVFSPKEVPATVADRSWERTVQVERYRTVTEVDWTLPSGGRELGRERAVRRYERVLDHYETRTRRVSDRVQTGTETYTCGTVDEGNGYFRDKTCTRPTYTTEYRTESYEEPVYRQEPVWGTRYRYEIERWKPERLVRASGGSGDLPDWPATGLAGSREREGGRTESYTVVFRDGGGKEYVKTLPQREWERYAPGAAVTLKVGMGGEVEVVTPPVTEPASTSP
ncbi:MAG TPA: hypothetical protein VHG51_15050 [Longimicrobiaceae bacterium]|nr:hypothetical protein [Longimicrobiaceae bacterium]